MNLAVIEINIIQKDAMLSLNFEKIHTILLGVFFLNSVSPDFGIRMFKNTCTACKQRT